MHKSRIGALVIDCKTDDIDSAGEFWRNALGYQVEKSDKPGDEIYRRLVGHENDPRILIQEVKHESRVHLDIETDNIDKEVKRLESLGAKIVEKVRTWVVMEAPTGHRFCVVNPQRPDFEENSNKWKSK